MFVLLFIPDDIDLRNVNPEMGARTLMRHLPTEHKEKIQMEVSLCGQEKRKGRLVVPNSIVFPPIHVYLEAFVQLFEYFSYFYKIAMISKFFQGGRVQSGAPKIRLRSCKMG